MYDYANGILLLHVQTETTCIPFVYNKNKLKFKKNIQYHSVGRWKTPKEKDKLAIIIIIEEKELGGDPVLQVFAEESILFSSK